MTGSRVLSVVTGVYTLGRRWNRLDDSLEVEAVLLAHVEAPHQR